MSIPHTQTALAIPAHNKPYTLITRPVPKPGKGDVLVRIEAIGVNPSENKVRRDAAWVIKEYPALTGQDGAGVVIDKGEGVDGFEVGDAVFFQGWLSPDRSSYQEYTLVYADRLARIPSNVTFAEAASLPLALATAALGLCLPPYTPPNEHGGAGLKPFWEDGAKDNKKNEPIMIFGGSSSVGQFVIQIATYMGFSPIITTSSLRHEAYLRSLGATHVIDRHCANVAHHIKTAIMPSFAGFSLIFDAVHTPIAQAEADLLAPGGLVIVIWPLPTGERTLKWIDGRRGSYFLGSVHLHSELGVGMYQRLEEFLKKEIIKPNRVEMLANGLSGIPKGLARLDRGEVSGVKLIACPTGTRADAHL